MSADIKIAVISPTAVADADARVVIEVDGVKVWEGTMSEWTRALSWVRFVREPQAA